jgi:hypothetical protein
MGSLSLCQRVGLNFISSSIPMVSIQYTKMRPGFSVGVHLSLATGNPHLPLSRR